MGGYLGALEARTKKPSKKQKKNNKTNISRNIWGLGGPGPEFPKILVLLVLLFFLFFSRFLGLGGFAFIRARGSESKLIQLEAQRICKQGCLSHCALPMFSKHCFSEIWRKNIHCFLLFLKLSTVEVL